MKPPRCRCCISHPLGRLDKLIFRRSVIEERITQAQDQLEIINGEIAELLVRA